MLQASSLLEQSKNLKVGPLGDWWKPPGTSLHSDAETKDFGSLPSRNFQDAAGVIKAEPTRKKRVTILNEAVPMPSER